MNQDDLLARLRALGSEKARESMARVGINTGRALGISVGELRRLAKSIGRHHELALSLWDTEIHEARILASLVADPSRVDDELMERWASDFDSWDLCDQVCGNLFDRTPHAWKKAVEWSGRPEEFVKRAGFALMAWLAVHDKQAQDPEFEQFLPLIEAEAGDTRKCVQQSISWALRQIGKRNVSLNRAAVQTAEYMAEQEDKSARWISREALRELTGEKVQQRLAR